MDSVKYIGNAADANSGIYHINEVNAGIKDGSWPTNYKIENSLRFNGTNSSLSRTPTNFAGTSTKTWTVSCWIKLCTTSHFYILDTTAGSAEETLRFDAGLIDYIHYQTSVTQRAISPSYYRDLSQWYHLVVAADTTLSVQNDRMKFFINGQQVINLSFTGFGPNDDLGFNKNELHVIGRRNSYNDRWAHGYLADFYFIDGQALDPSHFATTHPVTGRWVPKPYRGTYGTNGFHLDFSNKNSGTGVGTIGEDKSGNGNHWTTNNLDHSDVVPDSPTNNFATLNPLAPDINNSFSMSEGNLRLYTVSSFTSDGRNISTIPFVPAMGKIYIESAKHTDAFAFGFSQGNNAFGFYGRTDTNFEVIAGTNNGGNLTWQYRSNNGNFPFLNTSATEVIGVLIDFTNSQFKIKLASTDYTYSFSHNSWINFSNTENIVLVCSNGGNDGYGNFNFGQDPTFAGAKVPSKVYMDSNNKGRFFYQPPEGALALCEANFNQPEITPKQYPIDETNQHRLTYNGNVQQSKFIPYATDGYSLYNTETSGISFGSNSDFNFLHDGTTSYTISGWIYRTSSTGSAQLLLDTSNFGSGNVGIYSAIGSNNLLNFQINRGVGGSATAYLETNYAVPLNQWTYFSILHDSSITSGNTRLKVYVNGVETGYNTRTYNYNNSSSNSNRALYLGVYDGSTLGFTGYLADVRIIQNVDAANYTVPTSNVSPTGTNFLLSTLSKQFVDYSSNNYPITLTGSPEISDWSPYTPELVRKGVHFRQPEDYGGGSFYFDGTNNLKTIDSTDWNPEAQDFTIEGWYYLTETGNYYFLWGTGGSDGNEDIAMRVNTDNSILVYLRNSAGTLSTIGSTNTVSKNSWNHIALERYNNVIKIYLNGVAETNTFDATSWSGYNSETGMTIGGFGNYSIGGYWKGYIADFRIVKGSAVYQGNFTPPTAKLSTVTDTKLLLQPWQTATTRGVFTTPDTYKQDETGKALTYVGNASVVNTSPYKDGVTGSFNFGGQNSGDYIDLGNLGANVNLTGSYTFEGWVYVIGNTSAGGIITSYDDAASGWRIIFRSNSKIVFEYYGGTNFLEIDNVDSILNKWTHFVVVSDGTTVAGYINGSRKDTASHTTINGASTGGYTGQLMIGTNALDQAATWNMDGKIADLHFINGSAKYNPSNTTINVPYEPVTVDATNSVVLAQPGTGFTKNSAAQNPKKYFNTLLYTGNGGTQSITGLDFKPDLVWIKPRSLAYQHQWYDSVRGALKRIGSSLPNAENTETETLKSFTSNGFTLGTDAGTNASSSTNVAWCWKAGGNSNTFNINGTGYSTYNELQTANTSLPASSTSGMIVPSGMSINTDAGFSIVKYIGDGNNGATFPHGLNQTPDISIIKNLDSTVDNWFVGGYPNLSAFSANNKFMNLNTALEMQTASSNALTNGSSLITIDTAGSNLGSTGVNYIAYCWHSVEGYSKFGSFTGNNSTDGPFIYTGFRPAFLMTKLYTGTSNTDYHSWVIYDNVRQTANPNHSPLYANRSHAEGKRGNTAGDSGGDTLYLDFLSNGFKCRQNGTELNGNGGSNDKFIYMAFAEQPFTKTTAR